MVLNIKENVPYSFEDKQTMSDSISLKLFVSYGSYKEMPNVIKQISQENDSVYVWYSTRNKSYKTLVKGNTINEVELSPRIAFVSVDSVVIIKSENKSIKFFARIVR